LNNNIFKSTIFATLLTVTNLVNASVINLSVDNIGAIQSITDTSPEANIGFIVGESLSLRFTFDSSILLTPANGTTIAQDAFFDSGATLWLTGLTSGVTLDYFGGLIIEVDSKQEFELEGIEASATSTFTRIIGGDFDWDTKGSDIFSDISSLSTTFNELFANPFLNKSTNTASTRFWANGDSHLGMIIGPVPSSSTFSQTVVSTVPEPTSVVILSIGLLALASRKIKKQ